jgi:glycosyltransferase involved in cell wall biosynthesis
LAGVRLTNWHLITCEFPPRFGGVSDYCGQVAAGLRAAGEQVHVWCDEFDGFTSEGIARAAALIDACPAPRRLLVQWVPHGYGRRSMNVEFCRWIASRNDEIDLMVHEPGLGFLEGGIRHHAVAVVHRAMLALLLSKASRVWMSTAAWEPYLRPYLFGRKIPLAWAPVPSNIPVSPKGPDADYAAGYFGQYDAQGIRVLMKILEVVPDRVALIGRGAERVPMHERTIVIGEADPGRISRAIASCWVMCHHYIDGVTGRRTTAMASLAHGKAVVTVAGRLTEPLWRESGAVALSAAGDAAAMAENIQKLIRDHGERARLGEAGLKLYRERFSLEHTIAQLIG